MVLHTGTSMGYGALLTLLPAEGLGLFTSITGPDTSYLGRRALHMYVLDLLLGEDPWLNHTTACSLPQPWLHSSGKGGKSRGQSLSTQELAVYVGTYGNYGFGNVTIALNNSVGKLALTYGYGQFHLESTGKQHEFYGEGTGIVTAIRLSKLAFSSSGADGSVLDRLVIPAFESRDPPVFMRGLKMSSVPPRPAYECALVGSTGTTPTETSGGEDSRSKLIIIFLFFLVYNAHDNLF